MVNHVNKTKHVFEANPGGHCNLTLLGQLTDSSSSDESSHQLPPQMMQTQMIFPLSFGKSMINPSKQYAMNSFTLELGLLRGASLVLTISYMERLPGLMLALGLTLLI